MNIKVIPPNAKQFVPEISYVVKQLQKGSSVPHGWEPMNSQTSDLLQKAQNNFARQRGEDWANNTAKANFEECIKAADTFPGHATRFFFPDFKRIILFDSEAEALEYIKSAEKGKANLKPNEHQVSPQAPLEKKSSALLQPNTNTVVKKTYVTMFPNVKPGDTSFQQFFGKKPPKT